jgi:hypothetical protein
MDDGATRQQPCRLLKALAGLEVGILGGIVMLIWFAAHSMLLNQRWFAIPNLLASTFYGDLAFRSGFGKVTLAGIALHLCASGVLGTLFGLFLPLGQSRTRIFLIGMVVGLSWYYVLFGAFWKFVNPLVPLYSSEGTMVIGHALFGACLGRCTRALKSLQPEPSPGPVAPEIVESSHFPLE